MSGTGVVVWGIEFADGRVAYRWNSPTATTVTADNITDVVAIHGHEGASRLVWVDTERAADAWIRHVGVGEIPAPTRWD